MEIGVAAPLHVALDSKQEKSTVLWKPQVTGQLIVFFINKERTEFIRHS